MTHNYFCSLLLAMCLALANSPAAALTTTTATSGTTGSIPAEMEPCQAPEPVANEVWLVDTRRCSPSCCAADPLVMSVEQWADSCRWEPRSLDDLSSPSSQPHGTIVFVHGNRVSSAAAIQEGLQVGRVLQRQAGAGGGFRLVIFSWPSDQIHGQLNDVRLKAARTTPAAYLLSELLAQLPDDEPVGLIGYSFGARIATGSLQLLAGGQVGCYSLDTSSVAPRSGVRVVLIASAIHSHWLAVGQPFGLAISQIDRLLLLNNSCDPVLKRYHMLERCSNPAALGFVGLCESRLVGHAAQIEQVNATYSVGRSHSLGHYLCNGHLMARAWNCLQVDPAAATEQEALETSAKVNALEIHP